MAKPVLLVVMDGVGFSKTGLGDAVTLANTPTLDRLLSECPNTRLKAHGDAVGLPTDTWSLKKFTVEDYNKLLASIKDGSVKVDNDYTHLEKPETYANVNFELVK